MNKYSRRHPKFDYLPILYLSVYHICLNTFHGSDTYHMIKLLITFSGDSNSYSDRHSTLPFLVRFHYTPNCTSFFHGTNNTLLITYPTSCIPSQTLPTKNHTYLFSWVFVMPKRPQNLTPPLKKFYHTSSFNFQYQFMCCKTNH